MSLVTWSTEIKDARRDFGEALSIGPRCFSDNLLEGRWVRNSVGFDKKFVSNLKVQLDDFGISGPWIVCWGCSSMVPIPPSELSR